MIEYAKRYEEKLKQLYLGITFDPYYQFEIFSSGREVIKLSDSTYDCHDFVSLYEGEIIGTMGYQIRQDINAVWGLYIIHFEKSKNNFIFGKDVFTMMQNIFEVFHFSKINFSVAVGNPIEPTYDKLVCKKYGGRIVGINKRDVMLLDRKLYDRKEYEILAEDYFQVGSRRRQHV